MSHISLNITQKLNAKIDYFNNQPECAMSLNNDSLIDVLNGIDNNSLNNTQQTDLCGNISDEAIIEYMQAFTFAEKPDPIVIVETEDDQQPNGTLVSMALAGSPDAATIKQKIHDYRHPQIKSGDTYFTVDNASGPSYTGTYKTTSTTALYGGSFDNFYNKIKADTGLTKTQGIPRSKLFELTQKAEEDENLDLYGALNLAFSDRVAMPKANQEDQLITYKDLQIFFMRAGGYDGKITYYEYLQSVDNYANVLEAEFESKSLQGKFDFVYQKTKEYLEVAGLDLQLAALDRLYNEKGTTNAYNTSEPGHGQIRIQTMTNSAVGGGYASSGSAKVSTDVNGNPSNTYEANTFGTDSDSTGSPWGGAGSYGIKNGDRGIILNSSIFDEDTWYDIVGIFVHELTHATAYYYVDLDTVQPRLYTTDIGYFKPSEHGLKYMQALGLITTNEYNNYINNWDSIYAAKSNAYNKIVYLINTLTGEYSAYGQSANVVDALGGDVYIGRWEDNGFGSYSSVSGNFDLAVDAEYEVSQIKNHISNAGVYSKEPIPADQTYMAKYRNVGNLKEVGLNISA